MQAPIYWKRVFVDDSLTYSMQDIHFKSYSYRPVGSSVKNALLKKETKLVRYRKYSDITARLEHRSNTPIENNRILSRVDRKEKTFNFHFFGGKTAARVPIFQIFILPSICRPRIFRPGSPERPAAGIRQCNVIIIIILCFFNQNF